ncbi:MAG: formate dehydrogenase subunit alpha [Rhodospirillaceae bacterium]|nr:formate dehydrogenase subunit alpha [Rhodospirillaceae bacterium]MBT5779497.1 formate dehydrogenase subunit alpha [Rhodospirillaceae bacterium]
MSNKIKFTLDGQTLEASAGDTIWQCAERAGIEIPHLCYSKAPDYRADGNCRVCMVEIEGERVLAASCIREPSDGMVVNSANQRATTARKMVMELLVADQPAREGSHDPNSELWHWAEQMGQTESRFPARRTPAADNSHTAMAVNLDACIHCTRCVRACREVQVNDVIGMAGRGAGNKIVFDFDDAMGQSSCVACGECVQACPTGALMPAGGAGKIQADKQVDSVCPYCGVGCQLTFNVKDNKIVSVEGRDGPSNSERLCVKGRFGFDYINHSHRLTKPLIRRDDAPAKNADMDLDPANPLTHFREASWEEALDFAAAGLKQIRDEADGKALAGFGSAKGSNEEAYLFQKIVRAGFGSNNIDHCTRLCHASSVAALLETIGSGAVTASFNEARNSDVIIVIGAHPTSNHPVAATFLKNAVKRGAKLIIIDPRGSSLSRFATHFLQFKPGRDVALLNALMHVIVAEELYDEQYVQAHTEGFEQLRDHLKDFSPEEMAPICGIEPDVLRQVARLYAGAEAAIIFWGMGISQHIHGTDNARCLISLALMSGQVGRPGSGLHPLRGQNNVQGASDAGLIPMFYPDYQSVSDPAKQSKFEKLWGGSLDPERGLTVVEIMDAVHDGDIRGMYIMGENPAMSDPNAHHVREAFAKLDHLVVQEIFLTETAFFADVVLPATAWPEKDGTVTNSNRQIQMGRQAVDAPDGVMPDWWIIQEIARRIGLDWNYDHPADVFAEMKQCMDSLNNISWPRLERESAVTYPCDGEDLPGNDVLFADGFPTPSRRGKFVPASIIAPDEMPDAEYPMVLSTGRQLEHWHTGAMTRRSQTLDDLEPEAVAHLAPLEMDRLGIRPGDDIEVATRRGRIALKARADTGIPKGVVFVPFCYAEAAANMLTNPALDPFGKIPEFKFCAAKVEKAASAAAE